MLFHFARNFKLVAAIFGASAVTTCAFAQAPAAPTSHTSTPWTFQGLFDAYYLYDGNVPKGVGTHDITGFAYDEKASTPTLSLAELNISKAAPPGGGLGFKTTLIAGDTASINAPGGEEARYQNVQQLYLSYVLSCGAGVDIGKFYTPFGYEVTESNANYNYSRSFIFTDLLPVYHSGLRIYTPDYKGFVATAFVVKAINNADLGSSVFEGVYDANKSYGYIGQLNYTAPSGKFVAVETYGGSHDGPNGVQDKVLLSDTDLTVTPDAVNTFGFNYTNREDTFDVGSGVQDNGYALYYRRQITSPYAVGFRAEKIFSDINRSVSHADSLTATFEDKTTKNTLVRLEYRHDDASTGTFLAANGNGLVATQNTVSLSGIYTFGP
jgi:hypothetical protein